VQADTPPPFIVFWLPVAQVVVRVSRPPSGGNCTVTPRRGAALSMLFHVQCSGWRAEDSGFGPLSYSFEAIKADGTSVLLQGPGNASSLQVRAAVDEVRCRMSSVSLNLDFSVVAPCCRRSCLAVLTSPSQPLSGISWAPQPPRLCQASTSRRPTSRP
jgi:hypothetical protein